MEVADRASVITRWLAANDYPGSELIGERGFLRRRRAAWKIATYEQIVRAEHVIKPVYLLADGSFTYSWSNPTPMSFLRLCDELRHVEFDPLVIKRELDRWIAAEGL